MYYQIECLNSKSPDSSMFKVKVSRFFIHNNLAPRSLNYISISIISCKLALKTYFFSLAVKKKFRLYPRLASIRIYNEKKYCWGGAGGGVSQEQGLE